MPQSLSNVIIHTIFSTKNRTPFLTDRALRLELHAFMGGVAKALDCTPLIIGGTDDHVHVLTHLSRTRSQADFIKEIKRVSSLWLVKEKNLPQFHWQSGYGVFSVSESSVASVRAYIANQEEHHRKRTFQEEFLRFLHTHKIPYDERFVWD